MLNAYVPNWQLSSIYCLTPEELHQHHISLVLTDLDNTLVPWNHKEKTKQLMDWIDMMKQAGVPIVVVSNNKEERVRRVVEPLGIDYIARSKKPFTTGIRRALERYHKKPSEAVLIGDQLMTDIKAAHDAGVRSILVKPMVETDAWNTRINRYLEKKIKQSLQKKVQWQWRDQLI